MTKRDSMHVQTYVNDSGVKYLKSIGILYNTNRAMFSWQGVKEAFNANINNNHKIPLYIDGKKVILTTWSTSFFSEDKKYLILYGTNFQFST